jgi:hypothetical protein
MTRGRPKGSKNKAKSPVVENIPKQPENVPDMAKNEPVEVL